MFLRRSGPVFDQARAPLLLHFHFPVRSHLQSDSWMMLAFGIAFLIYGLTNWSLGSWLTPFTRPLQEICAATWSHEPLTTLGTAMICGLELPHGETKDLFLRAGLYHVLVVSGAHLVWLGELARLLFPRRPLWSASILLLFAAMTGFGAPLVRAGFQMLFQSLRPRPWLANLVGSYFAALTFHPGWWNSVSLHLSALAALAIGLPLRIRYRGLVVVALTLPVVLPFGSFTPLGAVTGILLSPLVEFVFFPLCVLAWLIPWLQPLANLVARAALAGLGQIENYFEAPAKIAPLLPASVLALYLFTLVAILFTFSSRGRLAI